MGTPLGFSGASICLASLEKQCLTLLITWYVGSLCPPLHALGWAGQSRRRGPYSPGSLFFSLSHIQNLTCGKPLSPGILQVLCWYWIQVGTFGLTFCLPFHQSVSRNFLNTCPLGTSMEWWKTGRDLPKAPWKAKGKGPQTPSRFLEKGHQSWILKVYKLVSGEGVREQCEQTAWRWQRHGRKGHAVIWGR